MSLPIDSKPATFPLVRVAAILTVCAAALGGGLWVVERVGLSGDLTRVALFCVPSCWVALLVGLAPIAWMGPRGVMPAITGYFIGMGARLVVCAAAAIVGIFLLDYPINPLLLTIAGIYIPLMFVEAALVGRYLWRLDAPTGGFHEESPPVVDGKKELSG